MAQEGRRFGPGRRRACRGVHRQGGHRDPVAGGRCADQHHRRGSRPRARRRRAGPHRQRFRGRRPRRAAAAARAQGRTQAGTRATTATTTTAPAPGAAEARTDAGPRTATEGGTRAESPTRTGPAGGRERRRHPLRDAAGAKTGRREQHRPQFGHRHRSGRPHPQARRAGGRPLRCR
nr:hypothetical protein [Mycobacterium intracellulare]